MDLPIDQYTDLSLLLPAQLDGERAVGVPVADGGGVEEKDGEVAGEGLCGFVI